jgi:hypothetical protein
MYVSFWPPPDKYHPRQRPLAYLGWVAAQLGVLIVIGFAAGPVLKFVADVLTNWNL